MTPKGVGTLWGQYGIKNDMSKIPLIEYGKYYHVYNKGINEENIFSDTYDYTRFLNLVSIFLKPIAEIYAYALMGNHFHFALRIKEEKEIGYLNSKQAQSEDLTKKWQTFFLKDIDKNQLSYYWRKPNPVKMFQHLFETYAKGFNNKYNRNGSLFMRPFKRINIEDEKYMKHLILYIHNNPIKHEFCENIDEYHWTSYMSLLSKKPTKLSRKTVIGWFDNKTNFINLHRKADDFNDMKDLFIEE